MLQIRTGKFLFDAFLLQTSNCVSKASVPVGTLKIGKEKPRGGARHPPSAAQRQRT